MKGLHVKTEQLPDGEEYRTDGAGKLTRVLESQSRILTLPHARFV